MHKHYYSSSLKISWISVILNLLVTIIKFIIGFMSNSIAILSDAAHSLCDLLTTGIVIVSLNISKRPADKVHPFGHERIEDVGGLILSIVLIIVGFNFLKESFMRLFHPSEVKINYIIRFK